jgi:phosphatidylglycerophosphate synthase
MARDGLSRRFARWLIRPLIGTPVRPNHLTTLRLLVALVACAALAAGTYRWDLVGGALWALAVLLDYADGELARQGGTTSALGQRWDYASDLIANGLVFVAIGVGSAARGLGPSAIGLGLLAGAGITAASLLAERLERRFGGGRKAYGAVAGLDFDEAMYAVTLCAWLGTLPVLLVGASLGGPAFALITLWRLRREAAREVS